jgi:hypothetical protein
MFVFTIDNNNAQDRRIVEAIGSTFLDRLNRLLRKLSCISSGNTKMAAVRIPEVGATIFMLSELPLCSFCTRGSFGLPGYSKWIFCILVAPKLRGFTIGTYFIQFLCLRADCNRTSPLQSGSRYEKRCSQFSK